MPLTSAEKKILTFVSIQSGDISVYRSCHIFLQPSAVTSSSDKRGWACIVTHRRVVSTSRETPLDRDSTHFSLSRHQSTLEHFASAPANSYLIYTCIKIQKQLSQEELSILNIDQSSEKLYNSCEINSYELLTKRPDLRYYQICFVTPGSSVRPPILLCRIRRSNCRLPMVHPWKDLLVMSRMHLIPR